AWFIDALGTDATVVTGPYTFAEGLTGLTLSARWKDRNGRVRGVFTVDFFLDDLSRKLAALAGSSGDAVLLDADGHLLASAGAVRSPSLASVAQAALTAHRDSVASLEPGRSMVAEIAAPSRDAKSGPGQALRASLSTIDAGQGIKWVLVVLE